MSVKRQATTDLNHENWDQEDPAEEEEMGSFKIASKEVLDKRVIRTAKRRSQISSTDESKKSVFSGFGGFNKSPPSSFDFLANLTNGDKANTSPSNKNETAMPSTLFSSSKTSSSPGGGIFSKTLSPTPKSAFGMPVSQTSSLFANPPVTSSSFSTSLADSTVTDSPFKIQSASSTTNTSTINITPKTTCSTTTTSVLTTQTLSSIFGTPPTSTNKSLFSSGITSSTMFTNQPVSNTTTVSTVHTASGITTKVTSNINGKGNISKEENNEKKLRYYAKLKGLNESVSDWIKKHVEETPLCILTPIFKDYENHLKEIQDEYQGSDKGNEQNKNIASPISEPSDSTSPVSNNKLTSTLVNKSPKPTLFSAQTTSTEEEKSQKSPFSFGVNTSTSLKTSTSPSGGFTFGINNSTQNTTVTSPAPFPFTINTTTTTTTAPFSFAMNTTTTTTTANGSTPFSFGIGKPFSFNANIQKPPESSNNKNEDDEPPKVDFTPVVEENSVFDKRCKIFVKKDGTFVDKGIGTLYIKKIEESGKHQLLVRANTNLGNVLLNLILSSSVPTQRMGKNNVMLVCIPTPDNKPPPMPVLIRVKTSEEADELLETLNKYKT